MGIAERKIREKEATRELILRVSWRIVKQQGWQSLSMRKIASSIEYSVPVIYNHFPNKEAILLAFVKQGFQKLNNALCGATVKQQSAEQRIEALAYAYLRFAATNTEYYQLMYGMGMPSCKMVRETAELSAFTDILLAPIRLVTCKNKSKEVDPLMKLRTFWSMLHGLVCITHMAGDHSDDQNKTVLKDFVHSFIAGIKN
ncbi:MAG TPA: TetR/AcrR family transcriptional regulator [Chitinophagaceae bacterium]|jgi:AcrR family transcriptional regulator|nr:TetR/AcrR family transcriptional regulator [Chitinophagaceae bacterium]